MTTPIPRVIAQLATTNGPVLRVLDLKTDPPTLQVDCLVLDREKTVMLLESLAGWLSQTRK